jgi:hypothetical protein
MSKVQKFILKASLKKLEFIFMFFTIPVLIMTLLLNMSVLVILWRKDRTIVNKLMMLDCMVNITFSSICTFQQSPFYRGLDVEFYCYFHSVLFFASMVCNRLLPVSIVISR